MDTELELHARSLFASGEFDAAEIAFGKAALAAPENARAQYNWGVALGKLDQIEDAFACYRRALELEPQFVDAYINFAGCLNELGMPAQARQGFALARQLDPSNPVPILNEGIAALALGDYAPGWRDFAARWELPAYAAYKRGYPEPYWTGQDVNGKTVFLFAEQGFGDTLQMARYIPLLIARGATVIVESPPATLRLLQTLEGKPQVIFKDGPRPHFDYYCALMDLPRGFNTRLESIPNVAPYLFAPHEDGDLFPPRIPGKKRIGLSWAGRQSHENDHNRSLALAQLNNLFAVEAVEWVSLQRLVPERDVSVLNVTPIAHFADQLEDFAVTAALIETLDLVISVDTAVAHLTGALGKPLWLLLPYAADWRWLQKRTDSPWYPTARLFRQQKRRAWDEVIQQVAALLSESV